MSPEFIVPCILSSLTFNKIRSSYLFKFRFLFTKSFENSIFSLELTTGNLKVSFGATKLGIYFFLKISKWG